MEKNTSIKIYSKTLKNLLYSLPFAICFKHSSRVIGKGYLCYESMVL